MRNNILEKSLLNWHTTAWNVIICLVSVLAKEERRVADGTKVVNTGDDSCRRIDLADLASYFFKYKSEQVRYSSEL